MFPGRSLPWPEVDVENIFYHCNSHDFDYTYLILFLHYILPRFFPFHYTFSKAKINVLSLFHISHNTEESAVHMIKVLD